MALVKCPECGTEVSDKAAACPKCAYPIANPHQSPSPIKVQTIEQTSKQIKLQILLSTLILLIGVVMFVFGAGTNESGPAGFGGLLAVVGLVWLIITYFRRWWHHG